MKRVWITGYRSYELGVFNQKDPKIKVIKYCLKNHLRSLLENGELDWVISGAQLGVEQWALEATIELQKDYPVNVSMMVPYQEFSNRWNEDNQNHFLSLKEQVDFLDQPPILLIKVLFNCEIIKILWFNIQIVPS